MTENKRFTSIRKKNPVSKKMGNYIQDNGTTILKLSSLEDCKDVCEVLNEQHELIIDLTENLSVASNREISKDDLIKRLQKENGRLKIKFKEERELITRLSKECDTLTIKKQELELEIIRLETIIKTGDNNDYNRAS